MTTIYYLFIFLFVRALPITWALECYKCAGLTATLDGNENDVTAGILSTVGGTLDTFLGFTLNEDCMTSDVALLQQFEGAETCTGSEECAYLNMTLTNEDYEGEGELVLRGVIRQCQIRGSDDSCFSGSGSSLTNDFLIQLMFNSFSDNYGTGDNNEEPQEVYGCYCSETNNCNLEYDGTGSTDDQSTTSGSGHLGGTLLGHMIAAILVLQM